MEALVYTGDRRSEIRDVPEAVASSGEALVAVEAAGICGSDMHAWSGHDPRRQPPLVLGHEVAGVVIEGPRTGRRVALNPLIACESCRDCNEGRRNLCASRGMIGMSRPGGFARRVAIPSRNLIDVPSGFDAVRASLMEPCACAWHAASLMARASARAVAACDALVIGGGAIGVLSGLVLRSWGVEDLVLAERNPLRRAVAEAAGLAVLESAGSLAEGSRDLVVDAVGSARTRGAAISAVRPGGVIAHIGLQEASGPFDARKLTLGEVTFLGTYTYVEADLLASIEALADGRLGSLDWIETRSLLDGAKAFCDIAEGRVAAPKIVLVP